MIKTQRRLALLIACVLTVSFLPMTNGHAEENNYINISIDTSKDNIKISPYVYGNNYDFNENEGTIPEVATASRLGGNRFTGYNWENNASNAGNDWQHTSDNYLNVNKSYNEQNIPGKVVTDFQDEALKNGTTYSIATLQMAGYVAKDKNGSVSENETAPSKRWDEVKVRKGKDFSKTPDLTDNYVYMDEFVNLLLSKYGKSDTATGIKGYCLDNEPSLWASNHPRIHKDKVACEEIISKSTEYAKMVKDMDANAEVFGPVLYGMGAYLNLQDAPDWNSVKGNYKWFPDYYLDSMKEASEKDGRRLLDVFNVNYYPEATGGGIRVSENIDTNVECNKARIQSPRTLWDSTYTEDSWIGKWASSYTPIIPKMKESINTYYPGTKFGITEYNFGGNNHISGGIAQVDALGIFGKNDLYFASYWPFSGKSDYTQAAFNLYKNYDGNKSTYGDIKVKAETSDIENSSVYAALDSKDNTKLHVIVINKNYDKPMTISFNIGGDKMYKSGRVWAFDESSAKITERTPITDIKDNKLQYTVPKLTACHIVLDLDSKVDPTVILGDVNGDSKVDILDYTMLQKYMLGEIDSINKTNSDINKDAKIDTADMFGLRKMILGA